MTYVLVFIIGVFIGWNIPQPEWAERLQNKIKTLIFGEE